MGQFGRITLEQANLWGGLSSGAELTQALITQISRQILTWLRRPNILPMRYTDVIAGQGNPRLTLKNWPVTAVAAVAVDDLAIQPIPSRPPAAATAYPTLGYYLKPWNCL